MFKNTITGDELEITSSGQEIGFLWWERFLAEIGFKSGMKRDRVMVDDRGEDNDGGCDAVDSCEKDMKSVKWG